jgi:hypothetical protein
VLLRNLGYSIEKPVIVKKKRSSIKSISPKVTNKSNINKKKSTSVIENNVE